MTPATPARPPLVTVLGGAGFIGSAVVHELARRPVRVRVVSRGRAPLPSDPVAEVSACRIDLTEPGSVQRAVANADAVIHLAAPNSGGQSWRATGSGTDRMNAGLMRDLVDAAQGDPPVVIFASTVLAGAPNHEPTDDYVRHKRMSEEILLQATADGRVQGVVLRPVTIYGQSPLTGSTGRGVISVMARKAVAGEPITMWNDGSVMRSFMHVRDAARAFVAALQYADRVRGQSWTLGTDRQERLGDVFAAIVRTAAEVTGGPEVPMVTVPPPEDATVHDFRSHRPVADHSAFGAVTGWSPQVSLPEGLREVIRAVLSAGGDCGRTAG